MKVVECDLSLNPLVCFLRVIRWYFLLRKRRPARIHAHTTRGALIPLTAAFFARVPIRIYHNHGIPYLGHAGVLRFLLRNLERLNCKLATHSLTVSPSNLSAIRHDGLREATTMKCLGSGSVVGIDLNEYRIETLLSEERRISSRDTFNVRPDCFVVGYVGRPVKRKGFHFLLHCWEKYNLGESWQLLIAGCSKEEVLDAAQGPLRNVIALGYISDMTKFYAAVDVVVLPSFHEGMSGALLEAAAMGKPAIGSDVPGVQDSIVRGETGLLVPLGDERAFVDAMSTLSRDSDHCVGMGLKARRRVEEEFDRRDVLNRLVLFYKELDSP